VTELIVLAPVSGRVVPLTEVPDPVFAGSMVGPGIAIEPDGVGDVVAVAPVPGVIGALHPHAYVVAGPGGGQRSVLVHLGIETVQLRGKGFTLLAEQGDQVDVGAELSRWTPSAVVAGGFSPLVPVIALAGASDTLEVIAEGSVRVGDPLLRWASEEGHAVQSQPRS
jgi:sugar PTS system EIIA component